MADPATQSEAGAPSSSAHENTNTSSNSSSNSNVSSHSNTKAHTHTLILLFHPLGSAVSTNRTILSTAKKQIPSLTTVDEYAQYPDGKIDIAHEQELLDAADDIVLQFPMHWYSAPALTQRWEDDVLAWGWAYGGGRHLLNKTLHVAVACGAPANNYTREVAGEQQIDRLLSPFEATAHRVHMNWGNHFALYGTSSLTDEQTVQAEHDYVDFLNNLK
jgi:glutathione-regulated potassium-efflux system ancillary protein KefG